MPPHHARQRRGFNAETQARRLADHLIPEYEGGFDAQDRSPPRRARRAICNREPPRYRDASNNGVGFQFGYGRAATRKRNKAQTAGVLVRAGQGNVGRWRWHPSDIAAPKTLLLFPRRYAPHSSR